MAEFLNQTVEPPLDGFNNMGKPIPPAQRERGYEACKAMGLDSARAWECVNTTAAQLERDKPHEAQGAAMRLLDLTGAYRLMATLLTPAPAPAPASKPAPVAPGKPGQREATACVLHERPDVKTVWLVEVPVGASASKLYQATTYPNSKLVFLQGESGRTIPTGVATKLLPIVHAAIERAQTSTGEPQ